MTRLSGWPLMLLLAGALTFVLLGGAPAAANYANGAGKPKIDRAGDYEPVIDPADFVDGVGDPLPIDNTFMSLTPGTTHYYEGETEDGFEEIEVYVTHDTRDILGVACVVVHELSYLDGDLIEETFDWFAQDCRGNVWYFGEYTEEYEDGMVSTEGSWEAGVDGAQPGIIMLAAPVPGASYRQEYYEEVAEDMAAVLRLDVTVEVAGVVYTGCLKTKEWTPLEPGHVEHKYYAPGVGLVLEVGLHGGMERIELVDITVE